MQGCVKYVYDVKAVYGGRRAVLHTVGQGAKYLSRSREEFVTRAAAATHLVLAGFGSPRETAHGQRAASGTARAGVTRP